MTTNHERRDPIGGDFIGERAVYPGHPVTCALIILRAYPDDLPDAWKPYSAANPWHACESYVDVGTAGGNLSNGCELIRYVLTGTLDVERAIQWGDDAWRGAGGHAANEAPGQEQADRLKQALRDALAVAVQRWGESVQLLRNTVTVTRNTTPTP